LVLKKNANVFLENCDYNIAPQFFSVQGEDVGGLFSVVEGELGASQDGAGLPHHPTQRQVGRASKSHDTFSLI
jgi:hypothetical protein